MKVLPGIIRNMDQKTKDTLSMIMDHLTLTNYEIDNVKNTIAMKLFKREMDIRQDLRNTQHQLTETEEKIEELQKQIQTIDAERKILQEELVKKPERTKVEPELIKKFEKQETVLKKELADEIKKWQNLKGDFEKIAGELDGGTAKALEEAFEKVDELENELSETESMIMGASSKEKAKLSKEKQNIKGKLTKAKKKYEDLQKQLKKSAKDPKKTEKVKNEIEAIIEKIYSLENEYEAFTEDLELDPAGTYSILESIFGGKESIDEMKKEIANSTANEKKLQTQLDVALKTVSELKKEMEIMDENYHNEIKKEYERMVKKINEEKSKEFDKKIKEASSDEIEKVEDKYKKLLKKQEDKYKKELEVAAQTLFELKQYIEELEHKGAAVKITGPAYKPGPKYPQQFYPQPGPGQKRDYGPIADVQNENNVGKRGFPLKLPRMQPKQNAKIGVNKKVRRKQKKRKYEMGKCGSCGEYIPINSESCPNCGATFAKVGEELGVCGNCGEIISVTMKSCPYCSAKFE